MHMHQPPGNIEFVGMGGILSSPFSFDSNGGLETADREMEGKGGGTWVCCRRLLHGDDSCTSEDRFRYVVVDSVHIKLLESDLKGEEITYKPHIAAYEGSEIIVIPRDRGISNAQESGFNPKWFEKEVMHKTTKCDCLITPIKIREFIEEIWRVSKRFHELKKSRKLRENLQDDIEKRILRAETSCNFFWGDSWVRKSV